MIKHCTKHCIEIIFIFPYSFTSRWLTANVKLEMDFDIYRILAGFLPMINASRDTIEKLTFFSRHYLKEFVRARKLDTKLYDIPSFIIIVY